jgi:hypothetical protein
LSLLIAEKQVCWCTTLCEGHCLWSQDIIAENFLFPQIDAGDNDGYKDLLPSRQSEFFDEALGDANSMVLDASVGRVFGGQSNNCMLRKAAIIQRQHPE